MNFDLTITASVLLMALSMIVGWVKMRNDAASKRLDANAERLDRHEARITKTEQVLQSMPGKDDMHKIELGIAEMRGDLKQLAASMDGHAKIMVRLETVVSRQEDHLLKGRG